MTTQTLPLPPAPPPAPGPAYLPNPGTYRAAPGRCIAELTARLAGLPTLRARLAPDSAVLTVTPEPAGCRLDLVLDSSSLDAGSLTTGRPFLSDRLRGPRGLNAHRHAHLAFHGDRIGPSGGPDGEAARLTVAGRLELRGATVPAVLRLRVVERDAARLLAVGDLRVPYQRVRKETGFTLPLTAPGRTLRLLVAVAFA